MAEGLRTMHERRLRPAGWALLAAALAVAFAPAAGALTLEEALRLTLETNPEVLSAAAGRRAADEAVDQARAGYFPRIDLRAGYGIENSKNASTIARPGRGPGESSTLNKVRREGALTLTQRVFDGFGVESQVATQRHASAAAANRVGVSAEGTGLDAVDAYLAVLRSRELMRIAEESVGVHRQFVDLTLMRAKAGAGRLADVQQAEARLALAESDLVETENRLRDEEARFIMSIGVAPDDLSLPVPPLAAVPDSLAGALALAFVNNPSLKAARSDVAAARAAVGVADSSFYPRLDLELAGSRSRDLDGIEGPNEDASALLVLNYNLFSGGADTARRREALEDVNQAIAEEQRIQRAVEEEVRFAWSSHLLSRDRVAALEAYADSAGALRYSYRQQFDIGQRSLLDLLDTEREVFAAQGQLVEAEFVALASAYRVLASTGTLLSSLGLAPPPEAVASR